MNLECFQFFFYSNRLLKDEFLVIYYTCLPLICLSLGFLEGCQVLVPRCGSSSWHMRWLLVLKPFISFELVLHRIPLVLKCISYKYYLCIDKLPIFIHSPKNYHLQTQENYMGKRRKTKFWRKFMSCTVVFKFQKKRDVTCLCFLILIGNKPENSTKFVRWDKTRSAIKGPKSKKKLTNHSSDIKN